MGAFRWNWSTPFILSESNPRTLYLGANHLFKSTDRGDSWRVASPDLTKNDIEKTLRKSGGLTPDEDPGGGAEFYGTIVTVAESPLDPGRDLGRHRRRQRADHAQRRRDVGGSREEPDGSPVEGSLHQPRRAVAPRAGHRLRVGRRARGGDLQAVRVQDDRLRQDVDEHQRQPARDGPGLRGAGRIRRTRTCCSWGRSSPCSIRSTAARSGRS